MSDDVPVPSDASQERSATSPSSQPRQVHPGLPPEPSVMQDLVEKAKAAASLGGQQLMDWLGKVNVSQKGPRDFVTDADFASQQSIMDFLGGHFPEHQFLGEEDLPETAVDLHHQDSPLPSSTKVSSEYCWIVDPLDGTTNFVHQLPGFSVSIGLFYRQQPLLGVVWDPILKEMFVGQAGQGAALNGKQIQTSQCQAIEKAMVVISLIKGISREHPEMGQLVRLLEQAGSIRRLGSAALNLCYVAMGRIDGYWANGLRIWDTAAGALIAREAGASLDSLDDVPFHGDRQSFVCAANSSLQEKISQLLVR